MYSLFFFFFNDTATTEIYTLSLHDALPISGGAAGAAANIPTYAQGGGAGGGNSNYQRAQESTKMGVGKTVTRTRVDRKSTRLNSSHANISYAVFCLKKKK